MGSPARHNDRRAPSNAGPKRRLPSVRMGRDVSELLVLALVVGDIAAGAFLIHSMTVTRSVVRVRAAALVSIVLTIALMIAISG